MDEHENTPPQPGADELTRRAEDAVIAGIIGRRNNGRDLDDLAAWLKPDHFHGTQARETYRACLSLQAKGQPISETQVIREIRDMGLPDWHNNYTLYVGSAADRVPPSTAHEALTVTDSYIRRRLDSVGLGLQQQARSHGLDTQELLDQYLERTTAAYHETKALADAAEESTRPRPVTGPTGFAEGRNLTQEELAQGIPGASGSPDSRPAREGDARESHVDVTQLNPAAPDRPQQGPAHVASPYEADPEYNPWAPPRPSEPEPVWTPYDEDPQYNPYAPPDAGI